MEDFGPLDGYNGSRTCKLRLQLCRCLLNPNQAGHRDACPHKKRFHLSKDTEDMIMLISQPRKPSLSNRAKSARVRGSRNIGALRPIMKDQHHQDSLFGNSFQSKSFFIVHPEWLSETVDNNDPEPLSRPPWPWEQPRYRQNIQIPITYKPEETTGEQEAEEDAINKASPPPLPYALPKGYTFTHPSIDETRPFEKNTQFGAPVVDTSVYKLGY